MKPNNPLVKHAVRILYFCIFMSLSFFLMTACSIAIIYMKDHGVDLGIIGELLPILLFFALIIYSFWLANESSSAFSEDNCFFLEAVIVSIKHSLMHLELLPIIGKYFNKRSKSGQETVRKIESLTRFDR